MNALEEQLERYRRTGYLVVPGALDAGQVEAANAAIDRDLAASSPFWMEREEGHVTLNVHMLLAHEEMDVTMRPPALLPILEAILGPELCAEEHSVRIRRPYLTDVDATTHTFSLIPGSAQGELWPLERYDLATAHHVEGEKGTAVLFNAGMFHAGNVRRSPLERRTIHIYCGRSSAPPISNYTIFPRRLWANGDEAVRRYYRRPNAITGLLLERF